VSTDRYDQFWAAYLGVPPAELTSPGLSIAPHAGLKGYNGVWFFRRDRRMVVSAPPEWVPVLRVRIESMYDASLGPGFFKDLFGEYAERTIGPAFQGYLATPAVPPERGAQVHPIAARDADVADAFRRSCGRDAWEYSGLHEATDYLCGVSEGGQVVAMAAYRAWTKEAGDVCVLTAEHSRGKGLGTAAAWSVVDRALEGGKLLLYQTLESNHGAMRIAERLGFEPYATHIAVRLRSAKPN
jgi:GNAT superfamily N-acetyltransferase